MRYLISFLLLFAILENVISDDSIKKRMLRVALKLKEIQKRREMQRKLQDGIEAIEENTAQPVPPVVEPTIPDVPYNDTGNDNPESSDPFGANTELPPNKPFNPPQKGNNKNANIQPVKFHSYSAKKTTDANGNTITTIEFRVYIYIFGIPIPKVIVYRLRITRKSRLRSLDDSGDESLKSECTLSDSDSSLAGQNATEGKAPNYDCTADSKNDIGDDAQVAINTDVDFAYSKPDGSFEFLGFDEISFNGNSSEEATNLQQSTEEVPQFSTLINGEIIPDGDTHTLRIQGSQRGNYFALGDNITMSFENLYKSGEDNVEPYECTINSSTPFILNCDTSRHSIRTSPNSLHLTSGVMNISVTKLRALEDVQQKLLMIEMEDYNDTNTVDYYTTGSNAKYRKKSSGLSGGAIAGIVIACVVVLVAASIAAIMLRKPSPPIDNSTVVGLKSADNI